MRKKGKKKKKQKKWHFLNKRERKKKKKKEKKNIQAMPRFELESLVSKTSVLTITPHRPRFLTHQNLAKPEHFHPLHSFFFNYFFILLF